MNEKISIHKINLPLAQDAVGSWKVPAKLKTDLYEFISDLKIGRAGKGKHKDKSIVKALYSLKSPFEFINKESNHITVEDIKRLEHALESNQLVSKKKTNLSSSTKNAYRKALKIFFKWKLGEVKATELVGWVDVNTEAKTPDHLSEQEIEKLYKACRTNQDRYLIAVLFDAGARIEEFLNIRKEDIRLPEGKDNFVKIDLKQEYSKTEGRVIGLYWKYSLEAVREYYMEKINEGIDTKDPMFVKEYDAIRIWLHRLGKRVLNKSIHAHLFRHSSATYYADKLNRQQLCIRYGWKFSSRSPDVYISRSGVEMKELDNKFVNTEISVLQEKLIRVEQEAKIAKDEFKKEMEERDNEMMEYFQSIRQEFGINQPTIKNKTFVVQKD